MILAGLIGGLWAYSKFVLERSLLPPVTIDLDHSVLGKQKEDWVVEIVLLLRNLGSSVAVVDSVQFELLYLVQDDDTECVADPSRGVFGRIYFPNSKGKHLNQEWDRRHGKVPCNSKKRDAESKKCQKYMKFSTHQTFIQPGTANKYTHMTTLPASTTFFLVRAEFLYIQQPSTISRGILWISHRLGIIHWPLDDIKKSHQLERTFAMHYTG